jgi:hypothetical protein
VFHYTYLPRDKRTSSGEYPKNSPDVASTRFVEKICHGKRTAGALKAFFFHLWLGDRVEWLLNLFLKITLEPEAWRKISVLVVIARLIYIS